MGGRTQDSGGEFESSLAIPCSYNNSPINSFLYSHLPLSAEYEQARRKHLKLVERMSLPMIRHAKLKNSIKSS
jgi:hypothetical protein